MILFFACIEFLLFYKIKIKNQKNKISPKNSNDLNEVRVDKNIISSKISHTKTSPVPYYLLCKNRLIHLIHFNS